MPVELFDHGAQKYTTGDLVSSSRSLQWPGIGVELRHHPSGELPPFDLTQTEIGIATRHEPGAVVRRCGNGLRQETKVTPGTIWTCPAGVREEDISIAGWHECLHIYLPSSRFAQLSEITSGASVYPHEVRYLAGLSDGLIQEVSWTLLEELRAPTSGGRVLVETLALSLTARLAQAYSAGHSGFANPLQSRCQIDDVRLNRVLEYMAQHIEDDISLDDL